MRAGENRLSHKSDTSLIHICSCQLRDHSAGELSMLPYGRIQRCVPIASRQRAEMREKEKKPSEDSEAENGLLGHVVTSL